MKLDEIKLLYDFNYWADQRIITACANVSAEQYAAPIQIGNGYTSLRTTLVHIIDGEWQWRITYAGHYSKPLPDEEYSATEFTEVQLPTLSGLEEFWESEKEAMLLYLDHLTEEELNGILRYVAPGNLVRERVLWQCLFHVVNHGTQHRAEAAAILTSYGQSPGELDFTQFLNALAAGDLKE
jgi:uncharacterized damage-inducible protein DinB